MHYFYSLPSVCRGQAVGGAVIAVNLKLLDAVHALECSEALQRHFGRACDKLQKLGTVCLVKGAQCTPEPLNLHKQRKIFTPEPLSMRLKL